MHRANRQQAAVKAIQRLGVYVMYDHELPSYDPPSRIAASFCRDLFGTDFLSHVL